MAFFKTKASKDLGREIGHDYDQYQKRLFLNLVSGTPIDTGHAQKGWRQVGKISDVINTGTDKIIIRNDVEYIQRLDEGHSGQAPRGIVQPALTKTRK